MNDRELLLSKTDNLYTIIQFQVNIPIYYYYYYK